MCSTVEPKIYEPLGKLGACKSKIFIALKSSHFIFDSQICNQKRKL